MKLNEMITLVLRLLALYLLFEFLLEFPQTVQAIYSIRQHNFMMDGSQAMLMILGFHLTSIFLAYIPTSILLFIKADALSRLFVKDVDKEIKLSGQLYDDIRACVFRCAGIYAIIVWGPEFAQVLCRTIIYGIWQPGRLPLLQRFYENWSALIGPIVGVSIGVWLSFSRQSFISFIRYTANGTRHAISTKEYECETTSQKLHDCNSTKRQK